jgi:hypothetical protein
MMQINIWGGGGAIECFEVFFSFFLNSILAVIYFFSLLFIIL